MSTVWKKAFVLFALVVVLATLGACAAPTPEKVVEKVTVKETVVVAGTPQVVEKVVEKVVTAVPPTPVPPKVQDTFIFGAQGEPVCLDPAIITDGISGRVINQVFEGLVKFDKDTTNPVASLAEKW